MSNQSGIAASQEVINDFQKFCSSDDRFLLIRIDDNEQLVVKDTVPTTQSITADFDTLHAEKLDPQQCLFVIVRKDQSGKQQQGFAFISYVPDTASVHDKMIYASTKNTVLRNLGLEYFEPILFVDDASELDGKGWSDVVASESAAKPLSDAELSLQKVKQNELAFGSEAQKRSLARDDSKNLSFAMDDKLESTLFGPEKVADGKLVSFGIDGERLVLNGVSSIADPAAQLQGKLAADQPSYNLLAYKSDYYFVYCCPSGSKVRDRMKYATSRLALTKALEKHGYQLKEIIEVGDPDEIDLSVFADKPAATDTGSGTRPNDLKFKKPRGPRRR